MIANARMYSVSPQAAADWRRLLSAIVEYSGLDIQVIDHHEPAPIEQLWSRADKAAVFMCGLPFSRFAPQPQLIAAPVPSPLAFRGLPRYWSEMVVRKGSTAQTIEDTYGGRLALTAADSQSGCWAALHYLEGAVRNFPPFREIVGPRVTPLGNMSAVIDVAAEVAPIDSYAYCLLQQYRPDLTSQLRVIARTAATPIPPLVGSGCNIGTLRSAFLEAHRIATIQPLMARLLLKEFVIPDPRSYDALRLNFESTQRYWIEHPLAAARHPGFHWKDAECRPATPPAIEREAS